MDMPLHSSQGTPLTTWNHIGHGWSYMELKGNHMQGIFTHINGISQAVVQKT